MSLEKTGPVRLNHYFAYLFNFTTNPGLFFRPANGGEQCDGDSEGFYRVCEQKVRAYFNRTFDHLNCNYQANSILSYLQWHAVNFKIFLSFTIYM